MQEGRGEQQQPETTLRISTIQVSGFKVFARPSFLGPFGDLTCIVGPNGTGKSVVGEALAFALGANARILRVKSLPEVISKIQGERGILPDSAEVKVDFWEVDMASQAITGNFSVRRSVARSGRTAMHVARTPITEHQASLGLSDGDSRHLQLSWRAVTAEELRRMLEPFGVHTAALERVVVTQHRRAVEVADPLRLALFIETLSGGAEARENTARLATELAEAEKEDEEMNTRYEVMERRCQELQPEVQQYNRYQHIYEEYLQRAEVVLTQNARLHERLGADVAKEITELAQQVAGAQEAQEAERKRADGLLADKEAAEATATAVAQRRREAETAQLKALEEAERAKVRARKSQEGAKCAKAVAASAAKYIAQGIPAQKDVVSQLDRVKMQVGELEAQLSALQSQQPGSGGAAAALFPPNVQKARAAWQAARAAAEAASITAAEAACRATQASSSISEIEEYTAAAEAAETARLAAAKEANRALKVAQKQLKKAERAVDTVRAAASAAGRELSSSRMTSARLQAACETASSDLQALGLSAEGGHGGGQSPDEAVAALGCQQDLHGAFLGRIHSVLKVTQQQAIVAVNAVLMESGGSHPNSLVTATRDAAVASIEHFRQHKVGRAHVTILDEITPIRRLQDLPEVLRRAGVRAQPLTGAIEGQAAVTCSAALADQLFGGWYLVDNAAAVQQVLQAGRQLRGGAGVNLVTLSGALFKEDGEVVGEKREDEIRRAQRYALGSSFVGLDGSGMGAGSGGGAAVDVGAISARLEKAAARLAAHEGQEKELVMRESAALAVLAETEGENAKCKEEFDAAQAKRKGEEKLVPLAHKAAAKARSFSNGAAAEVRELESDRDAASNEDQRRWEEEEKLRRAYLATVESSPDSKAVLDAEEAANELQGKLKAVLARESELEASLAAATTASRRQTETALAAKAAAEAHSAASREVNQFVDKAAAHAKELKAAEKELRGAESARKEAVAAWKAAVRSHQAAVTQHQRLLTQAQEASARQAEHVAKALEMSKEAEKAMSGLQNIAATRFEELPLLSPSPTAASPPTKNGATQKSSSDSEIEETTHSAHRKLRRKNSGQAAIPSGTGMIRRSGRRPEAARGDASAGEMADDGAVWDEEEVMMQMAELGKQRRDLDAQRDFINYDLITEAKEVGQRQRTLIGQLGAQEQKVSDLGRKHREAKQARYARFAGVMITAGTHLSRIYQRLTGGAGDAQCRFHQGEAQAFADGVTFSVRPDNGPWRSFSALSGGQQALASLALCLALQAAAPSPFYFFDEIDAALDTINAQRLADFLQGVTHEIQSPGGSSVGGSVGDSFAGPLPPQFIVVSHRDTMKVAADCLVTVLSVPNPGVQSVWVSVTSMQQGNGPEAVVCFTDEGNVTRVVEEGHESEGDEDGGPAGAEGMELVINS